MTNLGEAASTEVLAALLSARPEALDQLPIGPQLKSSPNAAARVLLQAARTHGIAPLVASSLQQRRIAEERPWLSALLAACRNDLLEGTALELLRQRETKRVLSCFHEHGLQPLILKGTALAYGLYQHPALRPRADTDLLMPPASEAATRRALGELGYVCEDPHDDLIIITQGEWSFTDTGGTSHFIDVHRTTSNAAVLAAPFPYDVLRSRAVALPELGQFALGLSDTDALLLSSAHRAGSLIQGEDRLIWYWDIHLLWQRMPIREREMLPDIARARGLAALCGDAMSSASRHFGTAVSLDTLDAMRAAGKHEAASCYLGGPEWRRRLANWRALQTSAQRRRWLMETAFPSAERLRRLYPEASESSPALLYIRRAWSRTCHILRG